MLIGIHGRQQTGKDEVGKMVQYLTMMDEVNPKDRVSFEKWKEGILPVLSKYRIRKFAYKLKQMVALLTGCTMDEIEDGDFKEKPLGEPWVVWKVIDGDLENWSEDTFVTLEEAEEFIEETCLGNPRLEKVELTLRMLLQLIGENCFRQIVHPNSWIIALFKGYVNCDKWVITDLRYPNEFNAIKERDGICIKVIRPGYSEVKAGEKISDKALDQYSFDHYILNDGNLEDLIEKVRKLLIKLKVIK